MSLVTADIHVTVDAEDDDIWASIEAGESLVVGVDAHDIVTALENNDDSILLFMKEVLEEAGSSDLMEALRLHIVEQLAPVPS